MHLPLSVLYSLCLRTNSGLSMGEFDMSLKCTLFWGHFIPFSGRIMCFMLYYVLPFWFYARVWFFSVVCRFLNHFTPNSTINECSFTPTDTPKSLCLWKEEKTEECQNKAHHEWSVVVPMAYVGPLSPKTCLFPHDCSTSRWFHYKKVIFNIFRTSIITSPYSILFSLD